MGSMLAHTRLPLALHSEDAQKDAAFHSRCQDFKSRRSLPGLRRSQAWVPQGQGFVRQRHAGERQRGLARAIQSPRQGGNVLQGPQTVPTVEIVATLPWG